MLITKSASICIAVLLSVIVTAIQPTFAEVYRRTNPDGTVEFTDIQEDETEKPLELEETSPGLIIPSNNKRLNIAPKLKTTPEDTQLKARIAITSPSHDSAIRDNAGNLIIKVKVEPELAQNHFITLSSSAGANAGPQKNIEFSLTNLDRGTHNFTATIVDETGKAITSSAPVTVHLLRNSILFRKHPSQR